MLAFSLHSRPSLRRSSLQPFTLPPFTLQSEALRPSTLHPLLPPCTPALHSHHPLSPFTPPLFTRHSRPSPLHPSLPPFTAPPFTLRPVALHYRHSTPPPVTLHLASLHPSIPPFTPTLHCAALHPSPRRPSQPPFDSHFIPPSLTHPVGTGVTPSYGQGTERAYVSV
jgi:hypothetical protein